MKWLVIVVAIVTVFSLLIIWAGLPPKEIAVEDQEHVDLCVSTVTNEPRLVFKRAGEARDSDCPTGFSFKAR